jgi:hypothetical protein
MSQFSLSNLSLRDLVNASRRVLSLEKDIPMFDHFLVIGLAPGEAVPSMFYHHGAPCAHSWRAEILSRFPQVRALGEEKWHTLL